MKLEGCPDSLRICSFLLLARVSNFDCGIAVPTEVHVVGCRKKQEPRALTVINSQAYPQGCLDFQLGTLLAFINPDPVLTEGPCV